MPNDEGSRPSPNLPTYAQLDSTLEALLTKILTEIGLSDKLSDKQRSELEDKINHFISEYVSTMYSIIKQDSKRRLQEIKTERNYGETSVQKHWGQALDLLDIFIDLSVSAGSEFNHEYRARAAVNQDYKFDVLSRLHARTCLIARESIWLLRGGYAHGAYSRWRTIYETSVISRFIASHGNDLAESFLLHAHIDSYKAAVQYKAAFDKETDIFTRAGYKPLEDDTLRELKQTYDGLVARYGTYYKNPYGWTFVVLQAKNPRFADIEQTVSQDHLRSFYDLASYGIHPSPKSAVFNIAVPDDQLDKLLLTGQSIYGLADPGAGTATNLNIVNTMLLQHSNLLEHKARIEVFDQLVAEIRTTFAESHSKLEPNRIHD